MPRSLLVCVHVIGLLNARQHGHSQSGGVGSCHLYTHVVVIPSVVYRIKNSFLIKKTYASMIGDKVIAATHLDRMVLHGHIRIENIQEVGIWIPPRIFLMQSIIIGYYIRIVGKVGSSRGLVEISFVL